MLLAGDIGGTKTNLALYSPDAGPKHPLAMQTLPSATYPTLEALIDAFLAEHPADVEGVCLGIPGPVVEGRVVATNLPWEITVPGLVEHLDAPHVDLLNDLQAIAYGTLIMEGDDLRTLSPGRAVPGGAIGIIAPGTGLGEGLLLWDGKGYRAHPSEGGHTDLPAHNDLEWGLVKFLSEKYGRASCERVCSGSGFPNVYDYLVSISYAPVPDALAAELDAAPDRTPVIMRAAGEGIAICETALDLFIRALGHEAGDLALTVVATGGIYLAGGMTGHLIDQLADGRFDQAFGDKGRLSYVLADMPVKAVINPNVGLHGAASYAMQQV